MENNVSIINRIIPDFPKRIDPTPLSNSHYFKALGYNKALDAVEVALIGKGDKERLPKGESLIVEITPFVSDYGFIRVMHIKGDRQYATARCFPKYEYVSLMADIKKKDYTALRFNPASWSGME